MLSNFGVTFMMTIFLIAVILVSAGCADETYSNSEDLEGGISWT
jgi:hypothetical protein